MGKRKRSLVRLAGLAITLAALALLAGACNLINPAEPTSKGEPARQEEAAKPPVVTSGCVACHTSSEKVKSSAAPPAPVVKSAEQAGEG